MTKIKKCYAKIEDVGKYIYMVNRNLKFVNTIQADENLDQYMVYDPNNEHVVEVNELLKDVELVFIMELKTKKL